MATMASAASQTRQARAPRPHRGTDLWLPPSGAGSAAPVGIDELEYLVSDSVQIVVRALVGHISSLEIAHQRAAGRRPQPVPLRILNLRRRIARTWIIAILQGRMDSASLFALATRWIPQLVGRGEDTRRPAATSRDLVEYVRGALAAQVMTEPANNLVPQAKALHALDTVLGVHLAALAGA